LHDLSALERITKIEALTSIGGDLHVSGVPELSQLSGMNSVETVGGLLTLSGPTALQSIPGLKALTSAQAVHLIDHAELRTTVGLSALRHAGIVLVDLDSLQSVPAPDLETTRTLELTRVGLDALDGWSGLTTAEALHVEDNPLLTSIDGLSSLATVSGDLTVRGNALLDEATVWEIIDRITKGGDVRVEDNGALLSD
jgi:hypothetical protein